MRGADNRLRNRFLAALIGTGLVALCCFTPVLVLLLAGLGLSILTPWLDFVLLPALVVLILLTLLAYRQWRRSQ
ncbi:mercury resistance system transport protein MerF [Geothermobacter hydrogeniphilus]|uniref:Mercury transporter n=1 Tax=Geothermobacter hydrogeniphilus TaxID=1969733 RepID=A0A1X0Y640_9BACT|nr:mercury resistance system transport protein MerF [Geothermobacter hydrogeniphilus]ORJ60579.1 mercury transporter [Geothermobacter hydrogeniphilus]